MEVSANLKQQNWQSASTVSGMVTSLEQEYENGRDVTFQSLLKEEELKHNIQSITTLFKTLFQDADESTKPVILNNEQWLASFSFIDFLRDVGKQFRLGPMLAKDSVKTRLHSDEGMSFTEFSYQVLQGFDFYHLFKEKQVILQLGGGDQWGNITGGIDLTRRMNQNQVFGLTLPLVTKSDGTKFGKTESGTIWLDSKKTSQYAFYQFWLNTADADVYKFLRYFTFLMKLPLSKLKRTMSKHKVDLQLKAFWQKK